jgi:hypothetical protein
MRHSPLHDRARDATGIWKSPTDGPWLTRSFRPRYTAAAAQYGLAAALSRHADELRGLQQRARAKAAAVRRRGPTRKSF